MFSYIPHADTFYIYHHMDCQHVAATFMMYICFLYVCATNKTHLHKTRIIIIIIHCFMGGVSSECNMLTPSVCLNNLMYCRTDQ